MFEQVTFSRLQAIDLLTIERQPSQARVLGSDLDNLEEAGALASQPVAWAARYQRRLVALFGIAEQYTGRHGTAWAILAPGIGSAHLAVTRFAAAALANSGLKRVDLLARAAETPLAWHGDRALEWAMRPVRRTPEVRWALMLGFRAAYVMQRYGEQSEPHVLFEWLGGIDG